MISIKPSASACRYTWREAGVTISLVSGHTLRPFKRRAVKRKSSIFPLPQEPMKHWSILTPLASFTGTTFLGLWGVATKGSSPPASTTMVSANWASASLLNDWNSGRSSSPKNSIVLESGSMMAFFAPISVDILQSVIRPSMENSFTAGPTNSIAR